MRRETRLRLFMSLRGNLFKQAKVIHKGSIEDTYSRMERSGTKVAVVVYKAAMEEFNGLLLPYKRYYLTGAKVRPETPCTKLALMNSIGSCTKKLWLKNSRKKCLLNCHAKSKFIRLWTCTNTRIQRTLEPVLLTLWNQFETEDDVGQHLANTVAAGNIILSMRTRVMTFNGTLRKKQMLRSLWRKECIETQTNCFHTHQPTKTCWVAGKLKYLGDNKSLWTPTCNNCRKNYNVPPNTPVKCRSCREDTLVEAKCRLPIAIEDETGNIHAMLYDSDAERVIPFNGTDLYPAKHQLFSPTLKNVINSLTQAREKPTAIAASESTIKKRISFDPHQSSTSGTSIPSTNIPESSTQQTHQTSTMCDASPTKKSRPKMD
ncbi:type one serine/threonine protein phosphatase 6 [Striga asiatica]|uniref:Type one serine/threonine protein phosphatase 6 n=1 Tax=Striga asiatica TaxID=4170 RepID=A0A5A7QK69_STRAF|nr:type one serine/threonine protein phosphatase 6 [Striga asiatica]